MIPDKIYLVKDAANPEGVFDTVASKKPMFQDDVCYIRKEALLEWANGWLAFKRSGIVLDDGFSYAMEELIKKLNEM